MASELFTHLGVACEFCYLSREELVNYITYLTSVMSPGEPKSGIGTPYSVSDAISEETNALLAIAAQEGFRNRKQAALKALACRKSIDILWCANDVAMQMFRRDGASCPLTGASFMKTKRGVVPNLAHIIPNSVAGKVSINFRHGFLDPISILSLTL